MGVLLVHPPMRILAAVVVVVLPLCGGGGAMRATADAIAVHGAPQVAAAVAEGAAAAMINTILRCGPVAAAIPGAGAGGRRAAAAAALLGLFHLFEESHLGTNQGYGMRSRLDVVSCAVSPSNARISIAELMAKSRKGAPTRLDLQFLVFRATHEMCRFFFQMHSSAKDTRPKA